jgi:hypothetical protein
MTGRIIKIDPLKGSRDRKNAFVRVYFQIKTFEMVDGAPAVAYKWAKTDLVPKFRNYSRWSPHLRVGSVFSGLRMKDTQTVDADSPIVFDKVTSISDEHYQEKMAHHVETLRLL